MAGNGIGWKVKLAVYRMQSGFYIKLSSLEKLFALALP